MIRPIPTLLPLLLIFILYPHLSSLDRASGTQPAFLHGVNSTAGNMTVGLGGRSWGGVGFVRASPEQVEPDLSDGDRFYLYETYHQHHHDDNHNHNHHALVTLSPGDTQGNKVRAEYDPPLRHDHMRNPHYHPHLHHPDTHGHFYKGHLHHGGHERSGFKGEGKGKEGKEREHDERGWEGVEVDGREGQGVQGEYDSIDPDRHDTPLTVRSQDPDLVGSSRWSSGPYAWRRSAFPTHRTDPSSEVGHSADSQYNNNDYLEKRKEPAGGKEWSNGPYAWKRVTGGSSVAKTKGNGLNRLTGEDGGEEKDEVPDRAWDGEEGWR